jgi:hypothetical protein
MTDFRFHLYAAGVLAPGLASLAQLAAVNRGGAQYIHSPVVLPAPAMLPAQERRRASQAVRLVLTCVEQAAHASPFAVDTLRSIFASDEGTGEVCQQMLEALATTRQVSPLLFSNSVLNAPSGYFSIAWRNREPATVISLGIESFAMGLLCAVTESLADGRPALLVAYDPPMAAPMDELLPIVDATAAAWIIDCGSPAAGAAPLASFGLSVEPGPQQSSPLPPWMPGGWATQSSARAIAALTLASAQPGAGMRFSMGAQTLALTRLGEPP